MGDQYEYPHIPLLESMKPTKRILLGKRLFWTEKKDGENVHIWMNKNQYAPTSDPFIQISSRHMLDASPEIKKKVMDSEDYIKVAQMLKDNPTWVIYVEECQKGRSVTGIETYDRNYLFLFDILDRTTNTFFNYTFIYQQAFHYGIPIVALYAETRHRTIKDLLKFSNHVYEQCLAVRLEGMVVKAYCDSEFGEHGLLQAKVKLDIPRPKKVKIVQGEPIYPAMPHSEVMGTINKVHQDLGNEKFQDVKIAMPMIATEIGKARKQHFFSSPEKKLFSYYLEYKEDRLDNA
jgi:hypothetical protein